MLTRPSAVGSRPAYLDNLFRDTPTTPSAHSSTSSISTNSTASAYDLRGQYHASRQLSPPVEELYLDRSDSISTNGKMKRRHFKLGSILNRRTYPTYPQTQDVSLNRPATSHPTTAPSSPRMTPPRTLAPPPPPPKDVTNAAAGAAVGRRPSLPKLQTDFPPPRAISTYAKRALPPVPGQAPVAPTPKPQRPKIMRAESNASSSGELSCQRCYYFAARNCQGYVLGGESGDACETCLQAGYFGAK